MAWLETLLAIVGYQPLPMASPRKIIVCIPEWGHYAVVSQRALIGGTRYTLRRASHPVR